MGQPAVNVALAGLFQELLTCFPTLKSQLPDWWPPEAQTTDAVTWATTLAAQGSTRQDILSQHAQRTTIFSRLFADGSTQPAAKRFMPITELKLAQSAIFPQEAATPAANKAAYDELQKELKRGLADRRTLGTAVNPTPYLVSTFDLLRRFTWCLPNPYVNTQESATSLFDFSRIVAALAPCYREGTPADAPTAAHVATLISGDISGIQDFIYTITARGATPGLRGRSFYLQLLTEAIARYLLKELGHLPPTSILYASGGHFYLIAPGDQTAALTTLRQKVSKKLLRHHRDLYVGLGCTPLTQSDFSPTNFPKAWRRLGTDMGKAKNRRFHELGADMFKTLFEPTKSGGEKDGECRVCHYEWEKTESFKQDDERFDDEGNPIRKCQMCDSLEAMGNELRNAHYVHWQTVPAQDKVRKNWRTVLAAFGANVDIFDNPTKLPTADAAGEIWAFNDLAFKAVSPTKYRLPITLSYIVNVTPTVTEEDRDKFLKAFPDTPKADQPRPNTVKPFELLEFQAKGVNRLGVLRMDVDDLGKIFQQGLGNNNGLVQNVALSTAVSLFFEGWLANLLTEIDPNGRDGLYSIYSGGDDLFIVGVWDLLPLLARRIATDWQKDYAAGNPALHVSAGISLHGSKYPLYQVARAAETALDAAKDYEDAHRNKKNAFTFLGRTFPWKAYEEIFADKQTLVKLEKEKDIGRSLFHHLQRLDAIYQAHVRKQIEDKAKTPKLYWGRGQWLHVYQMSRLAGRLRKDSQQDARDAVLTIKNKLKGKNFTYIHILGLSSRWAELETRNEREVSSDGDE